MKPQNIGLAAALRVAIATHVRRTEQDEVLRDVEQERRARESQAGVAAGDAYMRRVIASLTESDDA